MSLIYNPHTKKPQPWTYLLLLVLPVAFFLSLFVFGQKRAPNDPVPQDNRVFEEMEDE